MNSGGKVLCREVSTEAELLQDIHTDQICYINWYDVGFEGTKELLRNERRAVKLPILQCIPVPK